VELSPNALRQKADETRAAALRALHQTDALLARGLASESRSAATVAAILGDRASELERAAREAEGHSARLSEDQGRLIYAVLKVLLVGLGVPDAPPLGQVCRCVLLQASEGNELSLQPVEADVRRLRNALHKRDVGHAAAHGLAARRAPAEAVPPEPEPVTPPAPVDDAGPEPADPGQAADEPAPKPSIPAPVRLVAPPRVGRPPPSSSKWVLR
jgi:hypothetical protein